MKPEPSKKWEPTEAAFYGAMIGMTLAIVLEACDILASPFDDVDPFLYIAMKLAVFASCGAILFAAIAGMRHRSGQKLSRTNRR